MGSQDSLERRSGMNLGPAREQGGPGGAAGDFGRALGWSARVQRWAALGTGPLAGIMEWYRACVINEVFGLNAGCLEKEMPPKGTALKCERAYKPGSVIGNHLSRLCVAAKLKHATRMHGRKVTLSGRSTMLSSWGDCVKPGIARTPATNEPS